MKFIDQKWLVENLMKDRKVDDISNYYMGVYISPYDLEASSIIVRKGSFLIDAYTITSTSATKLSREILNMHSQYNIYHSIANNIAEISGIAEICSKHGCRLNIINLLSEGYNKKYVNKRTEHYYKMKTWFSDEAQICISEEQLQQFLRNELAQQILDIDVLVDEQGVPLIEPYETMHNRGLKIPCLVEALALTFDPRIITIDSIRGIGKRASASDTMMNYRLPHFYST